MKICQDKIYGINSAKPTHLYFTWQVILNSDKNLLISLGFSKFLQNTVYIMSQVFKI